MIKTTKIKLYIKLCGTLLSAMLLIAVFSSNVQAKNDLLSVRVGEHENYTRVVFDWNKHVNYKIKRGHDFIDIIFKAKNSTNNISNLKLKYLNGIKAIKHIKSTDKDTYIRIFLPKKIKHRDYRINNLVIFDLHYPASLKPAKKIAKPLKKQKKTKQVTKVKPKTIPAFKSVKKEIIVKPKTSHLTNLKKPVIEPQVPAVKVKTVEQQQLPLGYTTITLSTIKPASLAVFERFGSLWLVVDTSFASIIPVVAGGFSSKLGKAEQVEIDGGVAYRFNMPKHAELDSIRFNNLSWIISLKSAQKKTNPITAGQLRRITRPNKKPTAEIFLPSIEKILTLHDSKTKDDLYIITSKAAESRVSLDLRYPDFAILPAYQGIVIKPFSDTLSIKNKKNKIIISEPSGLIITEDIAELPAANIGESAEEHIKHTDAGQDISRLFDFYGWYRGGIESLRENQRKIESKISDAKSDEELASIYLEMALLYFANGYGSEALGALRAASMENPDLVKNPGFLAVKGGAEAMAGFPHRAIEDLSVKGLKNHPEAKIWRGYAAASSEQWRLAGKLFPKTNDIISRYPAHLAIPFTLYMAESALRLGDTVQAHKLLDTIQNIKDDLKPEQKSAQKYLQGELYRQEGETVKALKSWYPISKGRDRLYYVKSSLATVDLLRKINRLSDEDAQDRLETLRYVWRGDGLEIQTLHSIARLHLEKKEYIKGLDEMRRAVALSEEILQDSSILMADMNNIFNNLFVLGEANQMEPFEAVSIYNSFKELMPSGNDSIVAEQNYAEYLIQMDLLEDATKILEKQIKSNVIEPEKVAELGARLAALYLLDGQYQKGLSVLQRTERKGLSSDIINKRNLLQAQVLSNLGLKNQAITTLKNMSSVISQKLKADIYWKHNDWDAAAKTLTKILPPVNKTEFTQNTNNSELVLKTAVAYKLAGDSKKLQSLRKKYINVMENTPSGASFAVVTRDTKIELSLKDRQNVLNLVAEVDLFKDFISDYKTNK